MGVLAGMIVGFCAGMGVMYGSTTAVIMAYAKNNAGLVQQAELTSHILESCKPSPKFAKGKRRGV